MKRDANGCVIFEENEEKLIELLYNAQNQTWHAGLNASSFLEMQGLDFPVIDQIIGELIKNFIITSNKKAGTFKLTPYGRVCAVYVINKPKLEEKQVQFLEELFTRSTGEKNGDKEPATMNFCAVDRYVTGRSVSCNPVEVDHICVELNAQSLVEYELKEVKIFQDTEFERIRKIPTKRVKITAAGIAKIRSHNQEPEIPKAVSVSTEKSEPSGEKIKQVDDEVLPQENTAPVLNSGADLVVDNINGLLQRVVLGIVAIGLIIVIVFYK